MQLSWMLFLCIVPAEQMLVVFQCMCNANMQYVQLCFVQLSFVFFVQLPFVFCATVFCVLCFVFCVSAVVQRTCWLTAEMDALTHSLPILAVLLH